LHDSHCPGQRFRTVSDKGQLMRRSAVQPPDNVKSACIRTREVWKAIVRSSPMIIIRSAWEVFDWLSHGGQKH
jgi:hypothetical protein